MKPFCKECGNHHLHTEKHGRTNWEALARYWKQAYAELATQLTAHTGHSA